MFAVTRRQPRPYRHQSGYALLLFAVLLALGLIFAMINQLDGITLQQMRDQRTALALARAREALLAWSAAQADLGARPGNLPCPDNWGLGSSNYGKSSTCGSNGAIGRLPFKTLGIEELRDGYGEPLWYALDGAFSSSASIINSDSRGNLQAYAQDASTLITPQGEEAAAVILAPGPALPTQNRGIGATIGNYLEAITTPPRSNIVGRGPFIQGPVVDAGGNLLVNDSLLVVSAADVVHTAEIRVGIAAKQWLNAFNTSLHYLPYPARYNTAGCTDVSPVSTAISTDCISDPTQCRGRFPECVEAVAANCAASVNKGWPGGKLPTWFTANLWAQTIYYSVGDNHLAAPTGACAGNLSVDGQPVRGLIAFAGSPYRTIVRNTPTQSLQLADYLIDLANQDGWGTTADDSYTKPSVNSRNWLILLN